MRYIARATRVQEVLAGLSVCGVGGLLGYFGIRGAWMYVHGSRAAPADPLASSIGILAFLGAAYVGVRLLRGRRGDKALLPPFVLLVAGVGAIAGAVWFVTMDYSFHQPLGEMLRVEYMFGSIGVVAIVLWWRRVRKQRVR